MFNFVINKTLQVFTFRFAPDSARNESSGRSRIRIASSKHFLLLSRYQFPPVAFCPIPRHSLSNFPFQLEKSKPIGLAWIETLNYLLETLTWKVLAQQILQFAFGRRSWLCLEFKTFNKWKQLFWYFILAVYERKSVGIHYCMTQLHICVMSLIQE